MLIAYNPSLLNMFSMPYKKKTIFCSNVFLANSFVVVLSSEILRLIADGNIVGPIFRKQPDRLLPLRCRRCEMANFIARVTVIGNRSDRPTFLRAAGFTFKCNKHRRYKRVDIVPVKWSSGATRVRQSYTGQTKKTMTRLSSFPRSVPVRVYGPRPGFGTSGINACGEKKSRLRARNGFARARVPFPWKTERTRTTIVSRKRTLVERCDRNGFSTDHARRDDLFNNCR